MDRRRSLGFRAAGRILRPIRRAILPAVLILPIFCGALPMRTAAATAAKISGVALAQEGPAQAANPREVFSWIDDLLRIQLPTVARFEAIIGASFHRIERNDSAAVYETSGSSRPWVRRVELRLPDRANQGWSCFLILDLDPSRVELLPEDAMAYRPGARIGANPAVPPGWGGIWKYWELAAPDFLFWESEGETMILRFRSEGPRRLQQCSLYRKAAIPAAGRESRRTEKSSSRAVETGLGSGIDALLAESPEAAAQARVLQAAGWRFSWAPLAVSAIDLVQKTVLLPKDKNPKKSAAWLLWELGRIPQSPGGLAATRSGE